MESYVRRNKKHTNLLTVSRGTTGEGATWIHPHYCLLYTSYIFICTLANERKNVTAYDTHTKYHRNKIPRENELLSDDGWYYSIIILVLS